MLTCVAPRLRRPVLSTYPADFNVYYCASMLVRNHQAAHLYDGADTGVDPQKMLAPLQAPLFQVAQRQGLFFVGLYVYPPILADLLLPLTSLPLREAAHLWLVINLFLLALTAGVIARLLQVPLLTWRFGLILLTTLCFTPSLQCMVDGQITILLLLLWALGTLLFKERHDAAAGTVFALATAIKLTPGIVILPILLWGQWRVARSFVFTALALVGVSLWIDTPQALHTYVTRVLPAMSGAIPFYTNFSLPAAAQRLLTLLRTGTVAGFPAPLPASTVLAGRFASAAVTLALVAVIAWRARYSTHPEQAMTLGLLGLVAPVLSPVSWFHAYSTAFLAFALLWAECLRRPPGWAYLALLTAVSLLLGSAVSENLVTWLLTFGHTVAGTLLQVGQLVAAVCLVFWRLLRAPAIGGSNSDGPRSTDAAAPGLTVSGVKL